ncbi:MAG: 2-C-methyl-D-erythritol 4-phosphate cytidylyltransferase [Candidatus Marinimicrobia bacterium]|nr:2-C-methyl-D-erythritol 4-phosphate cytidylyltransferase [Candidatus Neomarinimicrobiota bacterium]MBL7023509.1 2-C-methyl-D-erythritol 4-phosphate cytidylyltransferase [Candidatus Neomarinimicrobiota bacterium]MBL7109411.1 2-C-methyl-D-erythritol 4-phosphate cytidylyltransferase [Candidatus Neomarinimicrobiota bacterium]
MITAIILAGGKGSRFGNEIPKQFLEINNRKIIDYSIQTFSNHNKIDEVIVVVHSDWIDEISKEYPNHKIICGGETRRDSSFAGLNACNPKTDKVLIHDSARPFVSNEIIANCVDALQNYKAITTAIPLVDTIVKVEDNIISDMPNRANLLAVQTPQGFHFKTIKSAHQNYTGDTTDDIRLVMSQNMESAIVEGSEFNFKITTETDLRKAKMIVNNL